MVSQSLPASRSVVLPPASPAKKNNAWGINQMAGTTRRTFALLGGVAALTISSSAFTSASAQVTTLDAITITATKTEEYAIDSLAPISTIRSEQIDQTRPSRLSDLFLAIPGVKFQDRGDEPGNAINIRGLQDFGRVAVLIDGTRQNAQRTGHFANGFFYLDPELIGGVDVVRGPTANIYGSGAIGGVVSIRLKEASDILRPNQRWAVETTGMLGSNTGSSLFSTFVAARDTNADVLFGGVFRDAQNYKDGTGFIIPNSWNETNSGLFKANFRPFDGHTVTLSGTILDSNYNFGQPPRNGQTGSSVYATNTETYNVNTRWRYQRPEDRLFDFDANVYWTRTDTNQLKILHTTTTNAAYCGGTVPGNNISGCIGDLRGFQLDTVGFNINNTTRFSGSTGWEHALTYGGDFFNDQVSTFDPRGTGALTTPGGRRNVFGGFLQLKSSFSNWLEIVAAGRYDQYDFEAAGASLSKSHFSPKITVGVTPWAGVQPYVSYAEGYRSPTLTETLIISAHPTGGGPPPAVCPDGTQGMFCFLQNLSLRPEIGRNKEIGVNFKFDNIYRPGDALRAKFNVFRNDVDDYIELVAFGPLVPMYNVPQFAQYQNITQARIEGVEFESTYDAKTWFVGLAAQYQRGKNVSTGIGLVNVQPNKVVTTVGLRFLEGKLTTMVRWAAVDHNTDLPANYVPSHHYNLVNLHVNYKVNEHTTLALNVDNLLNSYYQPYPTQRTTATDNQNDSVWASAGAGITVKGSIKVLFGDGVPLIPYGAFAAR